jgi:hypothetical protein
MFNKQNYGTSINTVPQKKYINFTQDEVNNSYSTSISEDDPTLGGGLLITNKDGSTTKYKWSDEKQTLVPVNDALNRDFNRELLTNGAFSQPYYDSSGKMFEPYKPTRFYEPEIIDSSALHNIEINDGIRCVAGDISLKSTGKIYPQTVTANTWSNKDNVKSENGAGALIQISSSSFCDPLKTGGYKIKIPTDAVLSGIKVYVRRRKVA